MDDMHEKMEALKEAGKTLAEYLDENHHPHITAIVTSTSIELVEGVMTGKYPYKSSKKEDENPKVYCGDCEYFDSKMVIFGSSDVICRAPYNLFTESTWEKLVVKQRSHPSEKNFDNRCDEYKENTNETKNWPRG